MGSFQYFLLYACPQPGIKADRRAAFAARDLSFFAVSDFFGSALFLASGCTVFFDDLDVSVNACPTDRYDDMVHIRNIGMIRAALAVIFNVR
jgi:hypothetical protein